VLVCSCGQESLRPLRGCFRHDLQNQCLLRVASILTFQTGANIWQELSMSISKGLVLRNERGLCVCVYMCVCVCVCVCVCGLQS
jgi:hypothetical protein